MIFVYQMSHGVMISEKPRRELLKTHGNLELLQMFHTIQDARTWCQKMKFSILSDIKKQHTGITPEGRELMREKKRGENNPNAGGLSLEHKRKISWRKKMTNRGEFHPMYNRKHRWESRVKTSMSLRRLPKRKWCVDPMGNEHFLFVHSTLPPGWAWGRKRNINRTL